MEFMKIMRVMANKGLPIEPDDPEAWEKEIEMHTNIYELFTNKIKSYSTTIEEDLELEKESNLS
jgi:hypothetical protein